MWWYYFFPQGPRDVSESSTLRIVDPRGAGDEEGKEISAPADAALRT
ncbi:MAG TPA: hypothetical protein VFS10_22635 [Pyrinomonadaceae bacterium]|nr:hypothetical protein [Pyrinomonadaceae bacterium]